MLVLDVLGKASNLAGLLQGEYVLFSDVVGVEWDVVVEADVDGNWIEDGVEEPCLDLVGATVVEGIFHGGV
jgi:hypothetical protein